MDDPKKQVIDKLKAANNILVTVSANPSVDQLSAAIGLTLFLNKLKKHATAVFSGPVPSTLEFLKPDETLEKNTDSLRDFIISLDKSKADKLRYKVEENVVKIFITPYRTSLTPDDLDFSQGDFNVDVVLALGVHQQQDLDQAITAHGRILHDATVMCVNLQPGGELGSMNWVKADASSLSELAVDLADNLSKDQMDSQIATALLTGIVAETERFSNEKTSPETMRLSAELLTAGANQQLVSSELEKGETAPEPGPQTDDFGAEAPAEPPKPQDGTLEINHAEGDGVETPETPEPAPEAVTEPTPENEPEAEAHSELPPPHYLTEPPVSVPGPLGMPGYEDEDAAFGGMPTVDNGGIPLLNRDQADEAQAEPAPEPAEPGAAEPVPSAPAAEAPAVEPVAPPVDDLQPAELSPFMPADSPVEPVTGTPAAPTDAEPANEQTLPQTPPANTLSDLEKAVNSPHVNAVDEFVPIESPDNAPPDVDAALKAVQDVYNSTPTTVESLPPKQDVGASGYLKIEDLPDMADAADSASAPEVIAPTPPTPPGVSVDPAGLVPFVPEPSPGLTPADTPLTMPLPPSVPLPPADDVPPATPPSGPTPPPPVAPPLPPSMINPS